MFNTTMKKKKKTRGKKKHHAKYRLKEKLKNTVACEIRVGIQRIVTLLGETARFQTPKSKQSIINNNNKK